MTEQDTPAFVVNIVAPDSEPVATINLYRDGTVTASGTLAPICTAKVLSRSLQHAVLAYTDTLDASEYRKDLRRRAANGMVEAVSSDDAVYHARHIADIIPDGIASALLRAAFGGSDD